MATFQMLFQMQPPTEALPSPQPIVEMTVFQGGAFYGSDFKELHNV